MPTHASPAALWSATALTVLLPAAVGAQPTLDAAFTPYMEVRTLTSALPGVPPPGSLPARRIAFDHHGAFGGRVAVAMLNPGSITLVDPQSGVLSPLGAASLGLVTDITIPAPGAYGGRAYFFQQSDLINPGRRPYWLAPGDLGLGTVFSATGMDAGSGMCFAPQSFGPTLGGQLFGSDSGNAPGFPSGDGIRRWLPDGTFVNEVMGPAIANPDTYSDLTFTGPEFGPAHSRLVAFNTTGVGGENILLFSEAALLANDASGAYNAREVFATAGGAPVSRGTYGAYGNHGYLFGLGAGTVYRYEASGSRVPLLTEPTGMSDVEFGPKRALYVTDNGSGLYAVQPSPGVFADWLQRSRCPLLQDAAQLVSGWQVGGNCPGQQLVCAAIAATSCQRTCISSADRTTIYAAIEAICANPC